MTRRIARRSLAFAAAGVFAASALAGCASQAAAPGEGETFEIYGVEVPFDQELRDMLPEDVLEKNKLVFSTDASQPPRSFIDEQGAVAGVTPDMLNALGALWDVEIEIRRDPFDTQVPGVESGRFDATTDTADLPLRREVFDMVDWFGGGWAYLTKAGNPNDIGNDPLDQCGLRLGLLKGGTQIPVAEELSAECVAEGLPPIDISIFQNVLLSVPLKADRVDVVWDGAAGSVYLAKTEPESFEIAGEVKTVAYAAFGINKDRPEFRDAMVAGLQELMDNGAYAAIAENWDQSEFAIDYISINSDVRE